MNGYCVTADSGCACSYGALSDCSSKAVSMISERIFHNARENTLACKDSKLRCKSLDFLNAFQFFVNCEITKGRLHCDTLPILLPDVSEEECFFEWIFNHVRVGFNISLNENDNGFFIITDDRFGSMDVSQPFDTEAPILEVLRIIEVCNG